MKYSFLLVVLVFCLGCQSPNDEPITLDLHQNWQFKSVTDSLWLEAKIPGNVHSDLLENKRIEDPFVGDNALGLKWIAETDWMYKTNFNVDKNTLNKKHIELNFEGLDTYASVYLNDRLILTTNNAFRGFNVDVKPYLSRGNELKIVFAKTSTQEEIEKNKLNYTLPEGNRIFTRKAQFQYGWDWGPELNTSGIWKPIKLMAWNDCKIDNVHVKQLALSDTLAQLSLDVSFDSSVEISKDLSYDIYVNNERQTVLNGNQENDHWTAQIDIKNPTRWWPHNLGEPHLYDIEVVVNKEGQLLDSHSTKIGLRTIELISEKDSIGQSFYFKVNDVPVYAKGANYIPQNSLQNKVTDEHYNRLLDDVVDANMNMLRVWGGGIYENDIFYDLCDQKGILVWQDFMFACAMYPGDDAFVENVRIEAEQQVKRLRHHPSIALWCGNNENSEGWHRWGWQGDRSEAEKEEIWGNYLKVFDDILPKVVAAHSSTSYWESSPSYGRGNPKYKTEGDAHDWWIWHDAYPFEHLEQNVPRFMSEFGFQSLPSYEAIRYVNQQDSIDISSVAFNTHQKHIRGTTLIQTYMERDYNVPQSVEDYVYVSQLLQAYGITKGIEAHRRAKPYNMGTLYWQLNDCWPAVSWSSIDYFGHWKALHYKAKRSFENVLISSIVDGDVLKIYIVNDALEDQTGILTTRILDFRGKELYTFSKEFKSQPLSSEVVHTLDLGSLNIDTTQVAIVSEFNTERSLKYLAKPKNLMLLQGEIKQKIAKTQDGFSIELSSTVLQKDVFLHTPIQGHFSNNFFDLLPGETKIVEFETQADSLDDLGVKTLNTFSLK